MFGIFKKKPVLYCSSGEGCVTLVDQDGQVRLSANPYEKGYDVVEKEFRNWAKDNGYQIVGGFHCTPFPAKRFRV